jgi:hypothetical protein
MRPKKQLRELDYNVLFRESINRLHKKWDAKINMQLGQAGHSAAGFEVVDDCCCYVLRTLINPTDYIHPHYGQFNHRMLVEWFSSNTDLFLDVMVTLRRQWNNPSNTWQVQEFILSHPLVTIENRTDGDICRDAEEYWKKKFSLATVKKARQLLSNPMSPKGKRLLKKSL